MAALSLNFDDKYKVFSVLNIASVCSRYFALITNRMVFFCLRKRVLNVFYMCCPIHQAYKLDME